MENDSESMVEQAYAGVSWKPGVASAARGAEAAKKADPEALNKLMGRMQVRRDVLVGILEYCQQPREVSDVDVRVEELQAHNASVYDAASLCAMLEKAGGLECVSDPDEEVEQPGQPQTETVDGVEYLRPAKQPRLMWRTTETGTEFLGSFEPQADLMRLLADDASYLDIYLRVLDLCADEGGTTTPALSAAIDKDPLVQSPRLFAQHFTERLEKAGAVRWDGRWNITDLGRSYLAQASR